MCECKLNPLARWLLISLALHVLLLLIFTDFAGLTVPASPQVGSAKIVATLHAASEPKAPLPDHLPSQLKESRAVPSLVVPAPAAPSGAMTKASPVVVEQVPLASTSISPAISRPAADEINVGESVRPATPSVNPDGLREYRLNLSREARRYKRYPAIARERGLEGVVVVVVSTTAGIPAPQVALSRSSGQAVLDAQALEMVTLAVRAAKLPDSLHGRDFGLDLPIHFSLEE